MTDKPKGTGKYKVGSTQLLTVKLSSGDLNIKVRLLEQRMVFGRSEWQIAPVAGNGTCWIQEASFANGVAWASPSENSASRHATSEGEVPPITKDDLETIPKSFASRRVRPST